MRLAFVRYPQKLPVERSAAHRDRGFHLIGGTATGERRRRRRERDACREASKNDLLAELPDTFDTIGHVHGLLFVPGPSEGAL